MSRVQIFSDSTNDLNDALRMEYGIKAVPLYVIFDDESYKDGLTIKPMRLFERVAQTRKLPQTAAPSPNDFEQAFAPHIDAGEDIVYIGLSSALSSTIQNAMIAAAQFEEGRVTVIDSKNLSTGIGLLVLKAAQAALDGMNAREIQAFIEPQIAKIEVEFIIDTLEYLHKGGRCSSVQAFIGSLLKIRPLVKVMDGSMVLTDKVRGKREKALDQLLNNALAQKEQIDEQFLFITHAMAAEEAEYLKQQIELHTNVKQVVITETGCVISSHCGPKTVGIVFAKK
ncbi:DegV family protein [Paenibacillus sp. SYP-B3998]|uniref:DegV family protein n=1 Tax=Paenibacillus sp. SYP-B3998 TaxID=2678564 RepID=A0A6G3ZYA7_9BACL|nr:DegV family protein [Paenibacillus sp. SYP-B3998]NEW06561.1 DegV family protein [Paenibacillus sp. SYP-B3998]